MKFLSPKSLKDALKMRSEDILPVLAGGTDLIVQWRSSGKFPEGVIDISGLKELKGIKDTGDSVEIGALETHSNIHQSEILKRFVPALSEACGTVGAVQIQNRGTIGGNVMNASPAGDTLPVLLAYDTKVELHGISGVRVVPFDRFFEGYRRTVVKKDELVAKFIIKKQGKGERSLFCKLGTRKAQAISKVCACFRHIEKGTGYFFGNEKVACPLYVIAYGSVAATPIRCRKTEGYLSSNRITQQIIEFAVKSVQGEVSPIDDIRSNASYRRHVSGVLLRRFLKS